jgi:predicted aspartyl protease
MNIFTNGSSYSVQETTSASPIIDIQIYLGEGRYSNPIPVTLDTGSDGGLLLPQSVLTELGLNPPMIGQKSTEAFDGQISTNPEINLTVRIMQIPSNRPLVYQNIQVVVSENASQGLCGVGLLKYCNVYVHCGKLERLEFNWRSFRSLPVYAKKR